jgi:hypothetical protein
MDPSLRANGSGLAGPMTGSAKQSRAAKDWIASSQVLLAMTETAWRTSMPGNRNLMFLIIGALIVVVGVLGYNLYEAKKEPKGVQINVGPDGLKIQNK